ncbi:alkaline phosphatase D [Leeuwenhoekiella aestuarii]|uniref:Alkaline phosphatase D n=1 Tax=Leeuwenhoekiella aestuarii TaxID=2249426 RepID=A0A4Q0NWB3_9FLAO|nr:alkaline phosphatase D family protein [Leeuwenhoekiella aestuarii]RXG15407.1 alkaline phosphatase D [Leeuwenhoekiella aestuarii]RXG17486.1 alkaline phosphatase D [Leeuwenhoekiella aestuarii]
MIKISKTNIFLLSITLFNFSFSEAQERNINLFRIAFGSCNKVDLANPFWEDMGNRDPDLFIWGGDVIYADTEDMSNMEEMYTVQKRNPAYKNFIANTEVLGTWDDHDYGINDGGADYAKKRQSQNLFLDFLGVADDAPSRNREGVYNSKTYVKAGKSIKVIVLDTRYFRTPLNASADPNKRYEPRRKKNGTILGEQQWQWFKEELSEKTDFTIIMSSIQLLSAEHGFETWGNFPKEVKRFIKAVKRSKANAVLVLSGDRHISEFSKKNMKDLAYPLIDFTSSGLTHSYTAYNGEPNRYRVGKVVSVRSYGLVDIDLNLNTVDMKIIGTEGEILGEIQQEY